MKNIMRCIVVDDEQLAIDLVCSYIEENPFLELAGTFLDLKKAVRFVMEGNVDLIFTDIELNVGMNGLDFVRSIPDAPMVIFISAYDRYAVDSYTVDAVDYLVKPVSRERFFKAVNKAYGIYVQKKGIPSPAGQDSSGQEASRPSDFMFVKVEGAGKLRALCNGDATDQTAFSSNYMKSFNGKLLAVVEPTGESGDVKITAYGHMLAPKTLTLKIQKPIETK